MGLITPAASLLTAYPLNKPTNSKTLRIIQATIKVAARDTALTLPPILTTATILYDTTRDYLKNSPAITIALLFSIDPAVAIVYESIAKSLTRIFPGFTYTGRITITNTLYALAISGLITDDPETIIVSSSSSAIISFLLIVL